MNSKVRAKGLFLSAYIILFLVVIFLCLFFLTKPAPGFTRGSFTIVEGQSELSFNPDLHGWVDDAGKLVKFGGDIPNGKSIFVNGTGKIVFKPGTNQQRGVFFVVSGKSLDGTDLTITVLFKRGSFWKTISKFMNSQQITGPVVLEEKFQLADEIEIQASGHCILLASDPVEYKIVAKEKRKYVFIVAPDTMRGDRVNAQHSGIQLTPRLNEFKRDAVFFSAAYSQSSWTYPAFRSLFTGLNDLNQHSLSKAAADKGRPTLLDHWARSFINVNFYDNFWIGPSCDWFRSCDYTQKVARTREQYGGRQLFQRAASLLQTTNMPALFMFMHSNQLHSPYYPPEEFLHILNPRPAYRELWAPTYQSQFVTNCPADKRQAMSELYDAEVLAFDAAFGEWLDFLKKIGIYDQSVIVFLSDHGEEFYEHQGWFHGHSLYDEITKIPLFIKFSDNAFAGRVIASPVGLVDVMPTLMDSLGIFCPKPIDGVSLLPLIRQPHRQLRETLLVSCTQQFKESLPVKFALLFKQYKLIYNFPYSEQNLKYYAPMGLPPWPGKIELYDLFSDPGETNNLYPAQKKLVAALQPRLAEILRKIFALPKDKRGFQRNLQLEEREELKTLGYL